MEQLVELIAQGAVALKADLIEGGADARTPRYLLQIQRRPSQCHVDFDQIGGGQLDAAAGEIFAGFGQGKGVKMDLAGGAAMPAALPADDFLQNPGGRGAADKQLHALLSRAPGVPEMFERIQKA